MKKLQIPNFKLQRNSKPQPPKYPEGRFEIWEFNEEGAPNGAERHVFDLEERTACFGEAIVRLTKRVPRNATTNRLIDQLVGSATSIGANYCEASERVSRKDFKNTIARCSKEAKEAK